MIKSKKLKSLFENNLFIAILVTLFSSLAIILFFSQHHSNNYGYRNEVDGRWYAQMKGFPISYAGFSIDNQEVPWYFLKVRNVNSAWADKVSEINDDAKVYVYFDLRFALPLFFIILLVFGCILITPNIIFKKEKVRRPLLRIDYFLLIMSIIATIFLF